MANSLQQPDLEAAAQPLLEAHGVLPLVLHLGQ
jgi:hypothetical protein